MAEDRKVSAWQRRWAVTGALTTWGTMAWLLTAHSAGQGMSFLAYVIGAPAATVPILVQDAPRTFARACLVGGLGLFTWALVSYAPGILLFVPAALMLLVAAFVGAENRPGGWFSLIAPFTAVVVTALLLPQPHRPSSENEPPPTLLAPLDSMSRFQDRDLNLRKEGLRDFGALDAGMVEMERGRLVLVVRMPRRFGEGQSLEELEEQVRRLPGVVDVRVCTFHTC